MNTLLLDKSSLKQIYLYNMIIQLENHLNFQRDEYYPLLIDVPILYI